MYDAFVAHKLLKQSKQDIKIEAIVNLLLLIQPTFFSFLFLPREILNI